MKDETYDEAKRDQVKKIPGPETEREAIDQALDLVVFREELVRGVREMRGVALLDVFGE